jgi:RimJ/RimL family protein N-acetyltransferase
VTAKTFGYRVMPRPRLGLGGLALRAVEPQDIESIRQWRNGQMDVLRQSKPISSEEQERYFAENVWPEMETEEPRQILLAIERSGVLIGYGGLVHISWADSRAEISFLLDPKAEKHPALRKEVFSDFMKLLQSLAFVDLHIKRLWTETYAMRHAHIEVLERSGFQLEGRMRNHILINGEVIDSLIHGLIFSDWKSSK